MLLLVTLFWAAVSQAVAPSPTPTTCSEPSRPIKLVWHKQPIYPPSAVSLNLPEIIVSVSVTVDAKGNVETATIYKGSGNHQIDLAAIDSARGSTYLPKIVDCQPVESTGLFTAEFRPG
jgi:TonB family protein